MDATLPYYIVDSVRKLPKAVATVVRITPNNDTESGFLDKEVIGSFLTKELAKFFVSALNDSAMANRKLGITPKCGEPGCDLERLHLGINITAVPCSDCGNIPGVRDNERYQAYLENKGIKPSGGIKLRKCDGLQDKQNADIRAEVSPYRGQSGITVSYQGSGPLPPETVYMSTDGVQQTVKSLAGRVLSILDAAIPNDLQREALKGLVRREVRTQLNRVGEFFKQRPIEISSEEEKITQPL